MPSLTQTAITARKTIKYSAIGLVAYIVLRFAVIYGIALYNYLNPPPPPAPTMGFGALPKLILPESDYVYKFTLETPTGTLPEMPDRATVYYMPYQRANLLALDQAQALAEKIGFTNKSTALSPEMHQWQRQIPAPLTMEMNIVSGAFTISYDWQIDESILLDKQFQGESRTLVMAQQFFEKTQLLHDDINYANGTVSYLKASGNKMISAVSLSEADFVKLDYFRNDIEGFPVLTPDPSKGIISMIFSGSTDANKQIVELDYNYFPADYLSPETYPLKSIDSAWETLKKGDGYIASAEQDLQAVVVRRIYLAYFDAEEAQQFLQPIYVFAGDNNFVAYVPAISDNVTKSEPNSYEN
ncbi:hypothetical protein GYA49_04150 [Candidatus Beckwithbacteria bacterium]|nr:hypothetical protein [Candidatus Beckwithbacteria bacterium]